jgi:hypothetical protein
MLREGSRSAHDAIRQWRAIGIVRGSHGLRLITVYQELDISGGRALVNHPGLGAAAAAVEAGEADVLSECFRRAQKERSAEGQARAVARGAIPWLGCRSATHGATTDA